MNDLNISVIVAIVLKVFIDGELLGRGFLKIICKTFGRI